MIRGPFTLSLPSLLSVYSRNVSKERSLTHNCEQAQERYDLLANKGAIDRFTKICRKERCVFSIVGTVVAEDEDGAARLVLTDREPTIEPLVLPIDLPMNVLFLPGRRTERKVARVKKTLYAFDASSSLKDAYGKSE